LLRLLKQADIGLDVIDWKEHYASTHLIVWLVDGKELSMATDSSISFIHTVDIINW